MKDRKFCPYCGEYLNGTEKYCRKCGKPVMVSGVYMEKQSSGKKGRFTGKTVYIIAAVMLFAVIGFWIYNHTDEKAIIGTCMVKDEDGTFTGNGLVFYESGKVKDKDSGLIGEYELENGEVILYKKDGWGSQAIVCKYELKGDRLILRPEETGTTIRLFKVKQ